MTHFTNKLIQTALLTSGLFLFSACGGGDGEGSIDVAAYLPANDMIKHYEIIDFNGTNTTRQRLTETITVDINAVDGHTVIDTEQRAEETDGTLIGIPRLQQDHIYDTYISSAEFNIDIDRFMNLGDSIFGEPVEISSFSIIADDGTAVPIMADCIYKSQHTDLPIDGIDYGEDFLETECTFSSDPVIVDGVQRQFHITSSMYQKKGIGTVFTKIAWCKVAPQILSDLDMGNCDENKTVYSIQLLDPADS